MKNTPAPFANHKNILLVDANLDTRDARAQMLRSRGATVDEVSGAVGARARFQSHAYNLVLIDPGSDLPGAERLAEEFKAEKPRQLVAFLVGGPHYVSLTTTPPRGKAKKVAPPREAPAAARDFGQQVRDIEAAEAASAPATTLDALNAEDVA